MSRLRGNPQRIICHGPGCIELAVIRCNSCKEYFCDDHWTEHLLNTVTVAKAPDGTIIEGPAAEKILKEQRRKNDTRNRN